MVEAFITDVQKKTQSKMLIHVLSETFPSCSINIDFSDRDKVLRIEGENIETSAIMILVNEHGFRCDILQ